MLCCIPGLGTWLDNVTAFLVPLCVTLGDIQPFRNNSCPGGDTEKPQTQSMSRVAGISHFQGEGFKETHTCKWTQQKRQNSPGEFFAAAGNEAPGELHIPQNTRVSRSPSLSSSPLWWQICEYAPIMKLKILLTIKEGEGKCVGLEKGPCSLESHP